ncbi:MAG: hypothetical protein WAO41_04600 [Candidatus Nanopelagicales bacterium]|jgi:hypothetical protein
MSGPERGHPIDGYIAVVVIAFLVTSIFAFLAGGYEQYWLAGVIFALWGIGSLFMFTRREKSPSH